MLANFNFLVFRDRVLGEYYETSEKLRHGRVLICTDHRALFSGSARSRGKILQRFPEKDWPDVPFNEGVALVNDSYLMQLANIF